jgi:hypothetical protein
LSEVVDQIAAAAALVAFVAAVVGVISAKRMRLIMTAIAFAVAVGGFLVFLGA